MGSRMMRRWLALPLKSLSEIGRRHGIVDYFLHHPEAQEQLQQHIKEIGDLERILSKVATQRVNPRELLQLKNALLAIEPIKYLSPTIRKRVFTNYRRKAKSLCVVER